MPRFDNLASPADVIYTYDGGFDGFLCCVYESVYSHEIPIDIFPHYDAPLTLISLKHIERDNEKAKRVLCSIRSKISARALELVHTVFLSCLKKKELHLLRFLIKGYAEGGRLVHSLGDPVTAPLLTAERHLLGEAHLLKGFIRFFDVGGALVSQINPKNFVLPFIANHFCLRFTSENFMIFDKTNKAALVYTNHQKSIIGLDSLEVPDITENEAAYQTLWKHFYNTVAIEGRDNPRCRMTHMPKRYWENMLEVSELL